ncbi:cation:proton antiporter [Clostridium perfringens]|uniref:Transporter, monovalent cation:proton antiporter-2 (CPA2) family n=1 Tax=Clostridium perfringens D str. JGS1721 TaxID=488537 RepID=B1V2H3_CLOPF|nr:cation:proton antiporter [Clostridium perfringens]EDT71993.1 transporter, monovalent cation:proton antiporter-2 (CPA2) family [Clostridium perfringens D str. JGS1721]EGT3612715.1 cation:proton antiporter [Clostridium perfringens]MBO3362961.1 cation:proton antiporter [Clostridium perfringens]PWX14044.1 cation:proton antiporter [Clostridium perfringens]HAT4256246.1 cation:proton antiporter [Clostridium perfringens]
MLSYEFLFDLALILISTKLFGLITKKVRMPQVVGALVAGVILGPAVLNVLSETEFIQKLAELGVIVLMFTAGLETDINQLKKTGKASFIIAVLGVIIPLAGGFFIASIFNNGNDVNTILQNVFIGIILTATSVSITVETLKEMGKLNTRAGNAILGAAIIDDILGIIALTITTSLADPSINVIIVLAKIVMFFIFAGFAGYLFHWAFIKLDERYQRDLRRFVIIAFVFCLLLSFCAEEFFGVADITGAFIAGLVISDSNRSKYLNSRFETLSYMLLSPIFFASIGIKVQLTAMTKTIFIFAILLLLVAILSKVFGCALGAKLCKYSNREAIQIGTGMISRGEVALIVANKGIAMGLMLPEFLAPVVIVVVVTTIVTPILLKVVFNNKSKSVDLNVKANV